MTAPGIYRAKVIAPYANGFVTVVIPQLFGDVHVYIDDFGSGALPLTPSMGWVMFEGGNEDDPVWMGEETSPFSTTNPVEAAPIGSYLNPWITEDQTPPPWSPGEFWLRPDD